MNEHALQLLLPCAELGIQVNGALNLRVKYVRGNDLYLTLAGRGGQVILRGACPTDWRRVIDQHHESCIQADLIPLWDLPNQSDYERKDELAYPRVTGHNERIAWLGSGLLRRVALFHNLSTAYSTSSWISGDDWVFELDACFQVGNNYAPILNSLTDEIWGLGLQIEDYTCQCNLPWEESKYAIKACYYYLSHPDLDKYGRLQLRFRTLGPGHAGADRDDFIEVGADPAWLDKVLPPTRGTGASQ
ncbi:hypothetical protein AB0K18_22440 [Nonomuraea sp. NPDC049421]|uniref:hypothetical protein n=1 Tax=Nonomuraea sp. NPDC049421 TaxID=3155275 RepID=UPI0034218AA5